MTDKKNCGMTQEEAVQSLNRLELKGIQKNFGVNVMVDAETHPDDALYGVVWALEKRSNANLQVKEIDTWTLKEISDYFIDPDNTVGGETEEGKG